MTQYRIVIHGNDVFESVRVTLATDFAYAFLKAYEHMQFCNTLTTERVRIACVQEVEGGS